MLFDEILVNSPFRLICLPVDFITKRTVPDKNEYIIDLLLNRGKHERAGFCMSDCNLESL